MKLNGFKFCFLIAIIIMSLGLPVLPAQTPYTNTGKAKNIVPTVDTFAIPGVIGTYRAGFITNQSTSKSLYVMFSKRDGTKDTSSRVLIPFGKTLHFNFVGTKIYRYTATGDTVFSEIIIGDVQLNYNENDFLNELCKYVPEYQSECVFTFYDPENKISLKPKEYRYYEKLTYVSNKGYRRERLYACKALRT